MKINIERFTWCRIWWNGCQIRLKRGMPEAGYE